MFPDAPNPTQIQFTPPNKRENPPPPLVLIHDGGGTTFSYFMLGNLYRDVWAIHDPRHWDATPCEGGIDEMAHRYISLMQAAGISETIILGGWSLGGYMSLAMARILADDLSFNITVAGIFLIDCPYHIPRSGLSTTPSETIVNSAPDFAKDWPDLVQRSFQNCSLMLDNWNVPVWDGPACGGEDIQVDVEGRSLVLRLGTVLQKPVGGSWRVAKTETYQHWELSTKTVCPPPSLLIRCTQATPHVQHDFRDEMLLGWSGNHPDFIKAIIEVDAEHYTLFDHYDHAKMVVLTARLNEGLGILDSLRAPSWPQSSLATI